MLILKLKKFAKSLLKVILMFVALFAILLKVIIGDNKLAQYRAHNFCKRAITKQSYQEIKSIIVQTKGLSSYIDIERIVRTNNSVLAVFPTMFPAYAFPYVAFARVSPFSKANPYPASLGPPGHHPKHSRVLPLFSVSRITPCCILRSSRNVIYTRRSL